MAFSYRQEHPYLMEEENKGLVDSKMARIRILPLTSRDMPATADKTPVKT